jgi:hypothetical protein
MGWSYRKSFGSGPFRINFSKSGVSYSVGVKGARINVGPRGTYVNLSSHGISYRKKINTNTPVNEPVFQPALLYEPTGQTIASAQIEQLSDSDSTAFIAELTEKAGQYSYVNWFGVFPLVIFIAVMAFTSFGSKIETLQPATDSLLVTVTSNIGVNVRQSPHAKSAILLSADYGQTFPLLDSSDQKWLKVQLTDTIGYISRRFAVIQPVHHNAVVQEQPALANQYAGYIFILGIFGFIALIIWLKKKDRERFAMELHYDMDEKFQEVYKQFNAHFAAFAASSRIWQYLHTHQVSDFKRNAGAGHLIKRLPVRQVSSNQMPLPYFQTNISIPCIKLSNLGLYFLPERLLIKRGSTFAAVFYKNLQVSSHITRFIEDQGTPNDARVVDHTWRYVNKRGGPDRRFNNNRRLPICAYSQYTLTSDTGIYEVITTSKQGAMDGFSEFLSAIGTLQAKMAIT